MSRYSRIDCKCWFNYHIFVNISLYLKNTFKVISSQSQSLGRFCRAAGGGHGAAEGGHSGLLPQDRQRRLREVRGLDARDKGYRATEFRLQLFSELQSQALFSPQNRESRASLPQECHLPRPGAQGGPRWPLDTNTPRAATGPSRKEVEKNRHPGRKRRGEQPRGAMGSWGRTAALHPGTGSQARRGVPGTAQHGWRGHVNHTSRTPLTEHPLCCHLRGCYSSWLS